MSNGSLEGLPLWARMVVIVGVQSAISIYLIYFITTGVSADITVVKSQIQENSVFLAQICRNTATNPDDRRACDRISTPR